MLRAAAVACAGTGFGGKTLKTDDVARQEIPTIEQMQDILRATVSAFGHAHKRSRAVEYETS